MKLIFFLLLTWILLPLVLEAVNHYVVKSRGVPAWAVSVIASFALALTANILFEVLPSTPFNLLALTAIIYLGSNGFFNVVIKPRIDRLKV